jgi:Tfp pilus assembly protein PilN
VTLSNATGPDATGPSTQGQTGQSLTTPVMPRVNLMPPEIAEAARFRRVQFAMGGAVVAAVAIVGALYVNAHSKVGAAQEELDAANAESTQLNSQLASLASVQDVYTQVAQRQAMLTQAMGNEIRWSYYLTDLSLKVPDNVWLTNLEAARSDATGVPGAPVAQPGVVTGPATVAEITYSGVAFEHDNVASWLDALAKEKGFVNPYFTNSSENFIGPKKVYDFTGTVGVTDEAKSNRYAKPAGS